MYFVYVLKSEVDGSFYKGYTQNLEVRIKEHNSGKSPYTSRKIPWKLVYSEQVDTLPEAIARERYFKTGAGRRFLKSIVTNIVELPPVRQV
ncbi:MAG: GIY-YIG nuclease family protein [Bacteroidales bacterium]